MDFWDGNAAAEWRLENARDTQEVWAWVEQHAEGRNPVVYVELTLGTTVALARLSGSDPTRTL
ncbi:hypothetical protein AB6N24_17850 [Cellulomonas sp. 179-A 4D5 NHS]|uniref:hypothetical protein n=1 Tax=Cellulomonas sp. 179-A 4D5 NHS TaxID=3142378 RepID=UPI00399F9CAD